MPDAKYGCGSAERPVLSVLHVKTLFFCCKKINFLRIFLPEFLTYVFIFHCCLQLFLLKLSFLLNCNLLWLLERRSGNSVN